MAQSAADAVSGIASLAERIRVRRKELEQATLARISGLPDPGSFDDPEYLRGLRGAVSAALDYGIAGLGTPAERLPSIPPQLAMQARFAARNGVPLETVLRRYFAGYTFLGDFVIAVAEEEGIAVRGADLQRIWRSESALLDRLLDVVAEQYREEERGRMWTSEQRSAERVRRLLAGELLDISPFNYDFDAWHVGVVASGAGAGGAVRALASAVDRRLLLVCPGGETVWAWLGGRHKVSARRVVSVASDLHSGIDFAFGEPACGLDGWRLTHRQARAALPVATRDSGGVVRYSDVALLASALRDEVLARSLRTEYLSPLEGERDGGEALRQTLLAYLVAGRNISSAASALGVSRQTVKNRVRLAEEKVGRPLDAHATDIETALRLHELDPPVEK